MKNQPTALVCGVSGQDGAYLSKFLLQKGYRVVGTSRDAQMGTFSNLRRLGITEKVELRSMAANDFRSVLQIIKQANPNEIYNLAGQSSVGLSFEQPVETHESIIVGTLNILEGIRFLNKDIRFYNASSGECFGDTGGVIATEETPFKPRSPYAVAKSAAFWQVANYRESYGLLACSGILFNHESPLRPERFVTQKIIQQAKKISLDKSKRLSLGRIDIQRDWGWAPEYVQAMWLMLQQESPRDLIIATGKSNTLEQFVSTAFSKLNLDWKNYVDLDESLARPSDVLMSCGSPKLAKQVLGWEYSTTLEQIINQMLFSHS
jgi:GDPmannose 4,6-dehydratase